jgi:hypothetical protein
MTYICERCGYKTFSLNNLIKHLNIKNPCEPIHSSITVQQHLQKLENIKYTSIFCQKDSDPNCSLYYIYCCAL